MTNQTAAIPEDELLDDEWPVRARRAGVRMRLPTAILLALLVCAGGAWAGSELQKHSGSSGSASGSANAASAFSAFRARAGAGAGPGFGRGAGGFGGGGGAGGGGFTAGTLTAIQGNVVYLTSSSGSLVKVKLQPTTTITRTSKAVKGGLKLGDTIIVTGSTGPGGTISATRLTATARGVTSRFGGLGGGGAAGAPSGG
jgi:hypothetical protein